MMGAQPGDRPAAHPIMKRIGITFGHRAWPEDEDNVWRMKQYIVAIEEAGALAEPLFLPDYKDIVTRAKEIATEFDGLMLSGGADLPPSMYGEVELASANVSLINLDRPEYELALLDEFVAQDKPVLGICYGCQLMNVWRGGTLIQDIPTQYTDPIEHGTGRHNVTILPGTRLFRIFGEA